MTKLVEESHNFIVLEQARLLRRGLGEVAHESSCWVAAVAILIDEALANVSSET